MIGGPGRIVVPAARVSAVITRCREKTYAQPTWDVRPPGRRGKTPKTHAPDALRSRHYRGDDRCRGEPQNPSGERRTCGDRLLQELLFAWIGPGAAPGAR